MGCGKTNTININEGCTIDAPGSTNSGLYLQPFSDLLWRHARLHKHVVRVGAVYCVRPGGANGDVDVIRICGGDERMVMRIVIHMGKVTWADVQACARGGVPPPVPIPPAYGRDGGVGCGCWLWAVSGMHGGGCGGVPSPHRPTWRRVCGRTTRVRCYGGGVEPRTERARAPHTHRSLSTRRRAGFQVCEVRLGV